MEFTFNTGTQQYDLQLSISADGHTVLGQLNGAEISWNESNHDVQAPRFYAIDADNELRVQYFRRRWYVTLNEKPLGNSATVAKTKLIRLSGFIYINAILISLLGGIGLLLDVTQVTIAIFSFGIAMIGLAYLVSKSKLYALIILIAVLAANVLYDFVVMYNYYELAPENIKIPFFIPCMKVLLELFFLVILVPGYQTIQEVRREQMKG